MAKYIALGLCVLFTLVACESYTKIPQEDLVTVAWQKIPLKAGILNLHSDNIGAESEITYDEDNGVVLDQAKALLNTVFDRVDTDPTRGDIDIHLVFTYTTELKDNMAYCRAKAIFYKPFTSTKIEEITRKATYEGKDYQRLDLIRYNSILRAQRKLISAMKGDPTLRDYAATLGRKLTEKPSIPGTVPATKRKTEPVVK